MVQPTKPQPELKLPVQAPSVLLLGETGCGKTYSLSTLAEAGLTVNVIVTEPTGLDSLIDVWLEKGLDPNKLRYHAITPMRAGFEGIIKTAQDVASGDFQSLAATKPSNNRKGNKFQEILATLHDFKDDRTGELYGSAAKFGSDQVVVIDSLSGLSLMSMDSVVGDKLSAHQGEWGVAMNQIERLLNICTSNLKCMFVMTGHLEREEDQLTGGTKVTASTLGKKLAPKIPRFFSEVVMAKRDGDKFVWSNTENGVALKKRALPLDRKIKPDFRPIVDAYNKRLQFTAVET